MYCTKVVHDAFLYVVSVFGELRFSLYAFLRGVSSRLCGLAAFFCSF